MLGSYDSHRSTNDGNSTKSEAIQLLSLRISIIQLITRGTDGFRTYWKHSNLDILIDIQYVCHLKIQISDLCCLIIKNIA